MSLMKIFSAYSPQCLNLGAVLLYNLVWRILKNGGKEKYLRKAGHSMKKILVVLLITILFLGGCAQTEVTQESETERDIPATTTNKEAETTPAAALQPTVEPTAAQTEEKNETKEVDLGAVEGVFGFADESGKKLITLESETIHTLANPEELDTAIGNNGEVVRIKYVKRQEANSSDTYRQTSHNFNNMAGYIYEAQDGELVKDKSYLLSKGSVIREDALIKLKSTRNPEPEGGYYQKAAAETIGTIEAIKGRKVIDSSLIAETGDNAKICMVVFERIDNGMLASIVYLKDDKVVFKDYPAEYDELSTWRVDAGDRPGLFGVLFLANSNEGLLLGLTWAGPEGESIFILKDTNGALEETGLKAGRYWAPL